MILVSLANQQRNTDSVLLNARTLSTGILQKTSALLQNPKCWHRFIVTNTDGLSRNEILKAVLDGVHPLDLIPVFYTKDQLNANSYFMARNCEAAIRKLCDNQLVVDHPIEKGYSPMTLSIVLNFSNTYDIKIDVQKNVSTVLNKRFHPTSKVLNLDRFHDDPDLTEFCPLSQPKIMYFVLHIAKALAPEEVILSNNCIRLLTPLDVLFGSKVKRLDLSHNEISKLNDLNSLKYFSLKELELTGNPLCNVDLKSYMSKIKSVCPTLEMLDGELLSIDKFPTTKKNSFACRNSTDLVNQFLEYFFTAYDRDRSDLEGLYHSNAMFSLTCVYLSGQISSGAASLKLYSNIARNLNKAADFAKTFERLFRGRENIMEVFTTKLPATQHDPYSFTTDLIYKTDTCAVVVVTGVCSECPKSMLERARLLGFTRSFSLEIKDAQCVITNDLLHLYNSLSYQEKNSFQVTKEPAKVVEKELIPKPQSESEYNELVSTLSQLTNLKMEWAKKYVSIARCLEECAFDLKKALQLFVDLYKGDKFPATSFLD
ncbi:hypothetical protein HUJ05_000551 [Dendroctonus ponderosae]|nr:hypothetical protein HUJ05_000551 [Dendroctonus ponderosae]